MITDKVIYGIIAGAFTLVCIGVKSYLDYKNCRKDISKVMESKERMDSIMHKLDIAIDDISDTVTVDIEDSMIDEAVKRAADRETEAAVKKAVSAVTSDIAFQANAAIRNAANEKAEKIKEGIEEKLTNSIRDKVMSTFDYFGLKDAVHKSCTKMAMDKLDGELDDISTKYKSSLDDAGKIYRKIAEKFDK